MKKAVFDNFERLAPGTIGQSPFILPVANQVSRRLMVKDKILCFACAVKNIERTFNTYFELQDHLYRDHDMKKDPAMDIFNKYRQPADSSASQ